MVEFHTELYNLGLTGLPLVKMNGNVHFMKGT